MIRYTAILNQHSQMWEVIYWYRNTDNQPWVRCPIEQHERQEIAEERARILQGPLDKR